MNLAGAAAGPATDRKPTRSVPVSGAGPEPKQLLILRRRPSDSPGVRIYVTVTRMVIMALTSPVAADIILLYYFRLQRSRDNNHQARAGPNFGPGMTDEPPPGQPPGRRAAARPRRP